MGLFRKDITDQEKNEILENFYNNCLDNGFLCKVILPQEELILHSYGAFTKGVATAGMGLVGLAATSGVSQEKKRITKRTQIKLVDKGIVFHKAGQDTKDLRIPYEDIICAEHIEGLLHSKEEIIITLLENQEIIVLLNPILSLHPNRDLKILRDHLIEVINRNAKGSSDPSEEGWY